MFLCGVPNYYWEGKYNIGKTISIPIRVLCFDTMYTLYTIHYVFFFLVLKNHVKWHTQ